MKPNFQERQYRESTFTRYSDEFKREIVMEVINGNITKEGARRLYGIKGKSAVLDWIRNYEYQKTVKPLKVDDPTVKESTAIELYRLQKELQYVQLQLDELQSLSDQKGMNSGMTSKPPYYPPRSLISISNHIYSGPRYHNRFMTWLQRIFKKSKNRTYK